MIKVVSVECPHCGHPLDIQPGTRYQYCPFCGVKLLIEDDSEKVNKTEIKIDQTYRTSNEAEVIRAQNEIAKMKASAEIKAEEKKRETKSTYLFLAVVLLVLFLFIFALMYLPRL